MIITGLFQKVISQSGTALAHWAQIPPNVARKKALAFGLLAGCPTKSTRAMVDCLRKIPAEELVLIHHKFFVSVLDNMYFVGKVGPFFV